MKFRWPGFNCYLLLMLALVAAVCGCKSGPSKAKNRLSALRLHIESSAGLTNGTQVVSIHRTQPVTLRIHSQPFLNEGFVKAARIVEIYGSFALQVQFDHQGTLLLEQYTAASQGLRLAIYGEFLKGPDYKVNVARWLAAPKITRPIKDGLLTFTPDATREEVDSIVLGLNNVAEQSQGSEPEL